jgi:hypothetical protein
MTLARKTLVLSDQEMPDQGMNAAWEQLQSEAVSLVTEATTAGVTLRVVGSAGIRLHCPRPGPVMDRLGRPAKDIDFIVPQQHRKGMRRLLESHGYVADRDLLIAMEGTRYTFTHAGHGIDIDVFVERLNFCHTIEVRDRLGVHPVTIPLEELLLQKIQIVEMTTTDVIDISVLLVTHDVGGEGGEAETIDSRHIARLLARDWGFHHTAVRNLRRTRDDRGGPAVSDLDERSRGLVRDRADRLLEAIDAEPKTLAWRMRDRIGERKQWWQDVDDKEATY